MSIKKNIVYNVSLREKGLKTPVIFDGRNIYDKNEVVSAGFDYVGIGFECVK